MDKTKSQLKYTIAAALTCMMGCTSFVMYSSYNALDTKISLNTNGVGHKTAEWNASKKSATTYTDSESTTLPTQVIGQAAANLTMQISLQLTRDAQSTQDRAENCAQCVLSSNEAPHQSSTITEMAKHSLSNQPLILSDASNKLKLPESAKFLQPALPYVSVPTTPSGTDTSEQVLGTSQVASQPVVETSHSKELKRTKLADPVEEATPSKTVKFTTPVESSGSRPKKRSLLQFCCYQQKNDSSVISESPYTEHKPDHVNRTSNQGIDPYIQILELQTMQIPVIVTKKDEERLLMLENWLIEAVKADLSSKNPYVSRSSANPVQDNILTRIVKDNYEGEVATKKAQLRNVYSASPSEISSWPNYTEYYSQTQLLADLESAPFANVSVQVINSTEYAEMTKMRDGKKPELCFDEFTYKNAKRHGIHVLNLSSECVQFFKNSPKNVPHVHMAGSGVISDIHHHWVARKSVALRGGATRFMATPPIHQNWEPYQQSFVQFLKLKYFEKVEGTNDLELVVDYIITIVAIHEMVEEIKELNYEELRTRIINQFLQAIPTQGTVTSAKQLLAALLQVQTSIVGSNASPVDLCREFQCYPMIYSFLNHVSSLHIRRNLPTLRDFAARFITRNVDSNIALRLLRLSDNHHPFSDVQFIYAFNDAFIQDCINESTEKVYVFTTDSVEEVRQFPNQYILRHDNTYYVFIRKAIQG